MVTLCLGDCADGWATNDRYPLPCRAVIKMPEVVRKSDVSFRIGFGLRRQAYVNGMRTRAVITAYFQKAL